MEETLLPLSTPIPAAAADTSPTTANAAADSPTSTTTTNSIVIRLAFLTFLGLISIWANHEASKGFTIATGNDDASTQAGRLFDLMFVSNDRASRFVLEANGFIQQMLYPTQDFYPKKPVEHVAVRLAGHDLSSVVVVKRDDGSHNKFTLLVSPSVMAGADVVTGMKSAIYRGMARVWLWDGRGTVPETFSEAMVEHLTTLAGFNQLPPPDSDRTVRLSPNGGSNNGSSLELPDRIAIARFLRFCEDRSHGFMARLNRAMRSNWKQDMAGGELGCRPGDGGEPADVRCLTEIGGSIG